MTGELGKIEHTVEEKLEEFWRHHHRRDKAERIVTGPKGYPAAEALKTVLGEGEGWAIYNGELPVSDIFSSREPAWENALFHLTQLNAWLLWKSEGEPFGTLTLANWIDAEDSLDHPSEPNSGSVNEP